MEMLSVHAQPFCCMPSYMPAIQYEPLCVSVCVFVCVCVRQFQFTPVYKLGVGAQSQALGLISRTLA